jgi:predicted DNA-binding transcriptional regulator YafY
MTFIYESKGPCVSQAKDTIARLLTLLRHIPRAPGYIATTTLLEKLRDRGFSVDMRTVQRDLNRLSSMFSLMCDERVTPYRWSFTKDASLDLRDIDPSAALALYLAEGHLTSLLPQSVLELLAPQFRRARDYLDGLEENGLADWARRVRTKPNGKALQPAQVDSAVWQAVSMALLERQCLKVSYLSRSKETLKELVIHPAGFVSRHSISYLIATVEGYDDPRQFALHRIKYAECLDTPAKEHVSFDIDEFLNSGFNNPAPITEIELVADVSPSIAWLLSETPLSAEQRLEPLPDSGWYRLHAKVPDDQETLWWVFRLGENVRVWGPTHWLESIQTRIEQVTALYQT